LSNSARFSGTTPVRRLTASARSGQSAIPGHTSPQADKPVRAPAKATLTATKVTGGATSTLTLAGTGRTKFHNGDITGGMSLVLAGTPTIKPSGGIASPRATRRAADRRHTAHIQGARQAGRMWTREYAAGWTSAVKSTNAE
jgi:hypothetical protein